MADVSVVKFSFEGEKFEILVKPDPALDFKLGKKKDISSVLVSDEIYSDSSKGTKPSTEKLLKAFKTEDQMAIAEIILKKGDLNLTTDQRRDCAAYCAGTIISKLRFSDFNGIILRNFSTISFTCSSVFF